jgi:hypothetical protein
MSRLNARRLATATVVAATLAACGSSSAPATTGTSTSSSTTASSPSSSSTTSSSAASSGQASGAPDACSLITADDAALAVGGPVGAPKPRATPGGGTSCSYIQEPVAVDSGTVAISVFSPGVTLASVREGLTDTQPLSGVGDDAFVAHQTGTAGANVGFQVGSTVVLISLGATGPTEALPAKAQALATAAAGRL